MRVCTTLNDCLTCTCKINNYLTYVNKERVSTLQSPLLKFEVRP